MIELYYPSTGTVTSNILLKNPDYGDSEQYDNNTLYHLGMDGTVMSYRKRNKQALLLNFTGLTKASYDAFETFYIANVGNVLGYEDVLGQKWHVRIINDPLEDSTTRGSGDCEIRTMTLQMRGYHD